MFYAISLNIYIYQIVHKGTRLVHIAIHKFIKDGYKQGGEGHVMTSLYCISQH